MWRWCRTTHDLTVVRAPMYRGCPCRDPLGCFRCLGRMASRAERQPLWLRCIGGGGHVMWTLLIHAFFKHTSSAREVWLSSLRVVTLNFACFSGFVACLAIVQVLCCLTHHMLELHRLDEICVPLQVFMSTYFPTLHSVLMSASQPCLRANLSSSFSSVCFSS